MAIQIDMTLLQMALNMIRKGQIRWLAEGDIVGQISFIHRLFGIVA
jgi:hypothetical protein